MNVCYLNIHPSRWEGIGRDGEREVSVTKSCDGCDGCCGCWCGCWCCKNDSGSCQNDVGVIAGDEILCEKNESHCKCLGNDEEG